jgi:hypothetical protein
MARGNFGERLKRERELREVSWEEITSATRIGSKFLEALENEDWQKLPGGVFNRGFVRSIARYLGLNEEVLLGEYDLAHGAPAPSPNGQAAVVESPASPRWKPAVFVLGALLLLAAIVVSGFYLWRHFAARHSVQQTTAAIRAPAVTEPSASMITTSAQFPPSPPGAPANADLGPLDLLVIAKAATHLLVLADGRVAFYDEVHAGERHHFGAEDNFEVTVADCGAVLLEMNGQAMPTLGPPGSSGTMKLKHDDLRQAPHGNAQR